MSRRGYNKYGSSRRAGRCEAADLSEAGLWTASSGHFGFRKDRKMRTIGIIGAMEVEVETLKKHMKVRRTVKKAGMEFCEGVLSGHDAVVVRSGIGKVNAAICAHILINDFGAEALINTGVAGSLRKEINIGDIVVSTDLLYHDMDATGFGYPLGKIPQMDVDTFQADERLCELAEKACKEVNPGIQVFHGRIVSGDQFVSSREVKDRILKNFDAFCTEMEGAAIAHAAWLNRTPFVVLRAISDKADDSASVDYDVFERQAAENCVRLVEKLLESDL